MGSKPRLSIGVYQNPRGDRTKESIKKYTDSIQGKNKKYRTEISDRGKVRKIELKGGGMSSGQAKIAAKAPPTNKIDAKDFAVLRAEKAKGRGMGLQDESVKPGKVMKANLGLMFMKKAKDKGAKGVEFLSPLAMLKRISGKKAGGVMKYKRGSGLDLPVISSVKPTVNKTKRAQNLSRMKIQFTKQRSRAGINSGTLDKILSKTKNPYSDLKATTAKGPKKYPSEFMKRRKELAGAQKALAATRLGKIVLPIAAAGVAAQQYLKSKMNKKKDVKKKMGGGMMQRPMGYSKGGGLDMGGPKAKIMQYIRDKKDDGQRLTMRDKDFIKSVMPKKKMGGGMMQKPMGYKTGGGYDSGTPGKLRDYSSKFNKDGVTYKNPRAMGPEESPRLKKLIKKKESRDKALKTTKSVLKTLSSVGSPMSAGVSAVYKIAKNMRSKDRLTERDIETARSAVGIGSKNRPIKKDHSSRNPNPKTPKMMNMGGMMMQRPMGYKYGTSVKAKCKLGRNKPTKIT